MLAMVLEPATTALVPGGAVLCTLAFQYWKARTVYNKAQGAEKYERDLSPTYPALVPYFGVAISFLWDTPAYLKSVT